MRILLATGIYPPDIGGPATYVKALAAELSKAGHEVGVLTYASDNRETSQEAWLITRVSRDGNFFARWWRYARALQVAGTGVDIVYCFSSVSVGIPLLLSRIRGPKRVLRLGGDFLWERYTDLGGRKTLRAFQSSLIGIFSRLLLWPVLYSFDSVIFSSLFQQTLSKRWFTAFPQSIVIENALSSTGIPFHHTRHDPLKVLFVGRLVRFKNIDRLVKAIARIPLATLTIIGDGPERQRLIGISKQMQMHGRVSILPSTDQKSLVQVFRDHDVLVLPSLTEISPNTALEARSAGLPVLLTEEHGLSSALCQYMSVRPLISATDITKAILELDHEYEHIAREAAMPLSVARERKSVANETIVYFQSLLQ
jgi:glycosyltransferase involved in cell wall biosynthesis